MQILEGYTEFESFSYIGRRYYSAAEATSLLSSVASLAINHLKFELKSTPRKHPRKVAGTLRRFKNPADNTVLHCKSDCL